MQTRPSGGNLQTDKRKDLQTLLESKAVELGTYLGKSFDVARYTSLALKTVRKTPKLLQCSPESVVAAVLDAAAVQLEIDGALGHAYLVPYKTEAQFQFGYKGLVELARRSGKVRSVEAVIVYEGDYFKMDRGLNNTLEHTPVMPGKRAKDKEDRDIVMGAYAIARWAGARADNGAVWEWMWVSEIDAIQARSPSGNSGPWMTDWHEMAKKTVIKRLCKTQLPLGSDAQRAIASRMLAQDDLFDAGIVEEPEEREAEVVPQTALQSVMGAPQNAQDEREPEHDQETGEVAFDQPAQEEVPRVRYVHNIPIEALANAHYATWSREPTNATNASSPLYQKTWDQVLAIGAGPEGGKIIEALKAALQHGARMHAEGKQLNVTYERAALTLEQIDLRRGAKGEAKSTELAFG